MADAAEAGDGLGESGGAAGDQRRPERCEQLATAGKVRIAEMGNVPDLRQGAGQQGQTVSGTSWKLGSVGTVVWEGVRLRDLLKRVGISPGAVSIQASFSVTSAV